MNLKDRKITARFIDRIGRIHTRAHNLAFDLEFDTEK